MAQTSSVSLYKEVAIAGQVVIQVSLQFVAKLAVGKAGGMLRSPNNPLATVFIANA